MVTTPDQPTPLPGAHSLPPQEPDRLPAEGIALCLSGGGYRAMLFHLGALWRLNDFGYLPKLDRISSVSGGSITSTCLGMSWSRLAFDANGIATQFIPQVVSPIRRMAAITVDIHAGLRGLLWFGTIAEKVANAYAKHLFADATLQDLPDRPRFVINATNVQSGALWRFMKPYLRDWRVGEIPRPGTRLAQVVAASSAFPPFLSPLCLELDPADFTPGSGTDLQREPYTSRVILSDGGVYDNLGLETAWKRYDTLLVSDAGGKMEAEPKPKRDWERHLIRVLGVIDNQVRALRKRQLIDAFQAREALVKAGLAAESDTVRRLSRSGAFWGIRTNIADYQLADAMDCPHAKTLELAAVKTRLAKTPQETQERLINWGYAVCDAAMRKYVDPTLPAPAGFPYAGGVG